MTKAFGIDFESLRQNIIKNSNGLKYPDYATFPNNPVNGRSLERTLEIHTAMQKEGFNSEMLKAALALKRTRKNGRLKQSNENREISFEDIELFGHYLASAYNNFKSAFFKELDQICYSLDIGFENVRKNITTTAEGFWNPKYGTFGGVAYAGTCLPKDTFSMETFLRDRAIYAPILDAAITVNETMKLNGYDKVSLKQLPEYFKKRMHSTYNNIKEEKEEIARV